MRQEEQQGRVNGIEEDSMEGAGGVEHDKSTTRGRVEYSGRHGTGQGRR